MPGKKNLTGKLTKGISNEKKFKGKPDLRNNKSKGTNGMQNNMPSTKEHQMMLGEGEVKPTPRNPRGYQVGAKTVVRAKTVVQHLTVKPCNSTYLQ